MRMAGSLQTPEDAECPQAEAVHHSGLEFNAGSRNRSAFKSCRMLCDLGKKPSFSVFICEMGKITVATSQGCSKGSKDVDVKA